MIKNKTSITFGIANTLLLVSFIWHPKTNFGKLVFAVMFVMILVLFIIDAIEANH
ncbi:hypothetical protein [Lactobacillus agrestimuris]|uniref:hypothetical protein n=1 Tax=Lactobacillus agrestimuris TaxID=2941328 RepID=UPI00204474A0|nr:hypothetical protein [Lactobacillus agrestimuris]